MVPFRRSAALRDGSVSRYRLDHEYVRVYPDVYLHREISIDPVLRAQAVWCWAGAGVLAGWSAAAMWGVKWIDSSASGGINLQGHQHSPAGLTVYRDVLSPNDIELWRSYPVTTPVRTAFDLGRRLPLDDAVEAVDSIYHATTLSATDLAVYADKHSGSRGIAQLRKVIQLSDAGAESPWETKTRLAIVRAGFPRPESQLVVTDSAGRFIGRADLGWRPLGVLVEYEGDHHFEPWQRSRDIERWNALEAAGWRVIRVKSRQLTHGCDTLMQQLRSVLEQAERATSAHNRTETEQ